MYCIFCLFNGILSFNVFQVKEDAALNVMGLFANQVQTYYFGIH